MSDGAATSPSGASADSAQPAAAVEAIARGLRRRVRDLRLAEDRLAQFAFEEDAARTPDADRPDENSWRHFALRALAVVGDPANDSVLRQLVRDGDSRLEDVAAWLGVDRVAAIDRVSLLTQTGCVARDLEHDRVGATGLGHGLVELVEAIGRAAASQERREAESPDSRLSPAGDVEREETAP